jgi:hypothetical protein
MLTGYAIVGLIDLATGKVLSQSPPCSHTTHLLIYQECFSHPTQSPSSGSYLVHGHSTLLRIPEVLYSIPLRRLLVQSQTFDGFLPSVQENMRTAY